MLWYQSGQYFTKDTWMTYIITTRKILLINYVGLNNCPPKVKLTIESNPLRFLDTEIINNNGVIETRVHRRKTKLATLWTSNIPTRFKWFTIKAELYQAKHVSSNFTNEITSIRNKFK